LFLKDGSILSYKLFVATYLGFGANEARRRYILLRLRNSTSVEIQDDCLMNGHKVKEDGIILKGTGNYDQCLKKVSHLLNNGLPCPDNPCYFNGVHIPISNFSEFNFVGVSEFWYTSTNVYNLGGIYNSTSFLSKFSSLCSLNWNDSPFAKPTDHDNPVDYYCFKSSWIYNFLHLGLRLSTQQNLDGKSSLEFVNEIGNSELSWTLGAILMSICSNHDRKIAVTPLRHWTLGLIFLFFGFLLLYFLHNCSRKLLAYPSYSNFERPRKNSGPLSPLTEIF
jgi:Golgi apyrase